MYFIDFSSEHGALTAMRRHQGALGTPTFAGLVLDFDKDRREKRNAAYEKAKSGTEKDEALFCVLCHFPCLFLAGGSRLDTLPRRGTDNALVVEEATALKQLACVEGEALLIKREGGRVERQVPLACKQCKVRWGYRPVPLGTSTTFLYIHDKALTHSLRGGEEGHLLKEEIRGAMKRPRERQQQQQEVEGGAARTAAGGGQEGEGTAPEMELQQQEQEQEGKEEELEGKEGGEERVVEGEGVVGGDHQPSETAFSSDALAIRFERFLARRPKS
jgi:hypothetical protein